MCALVLWCGGCILSVFAQVNFVFSRLVFRLHNETDKNETKVTFYFYRLLTCNQVVKVVTANNGEYRQVYCRRITETVVTFSGDNIFFSYFQVVYIQASSVFFYTESSSESLCMPVCFRFACITSSVWFWMLHLSISYYSLTCLTLGLGWISMKNGENIFLA